MQHQKACLMVSMTNLYNAPYYLRYLPYLSAPWDLIYWNRDGVMEDFSGLGADQVTAYNVQCAIGKQPMKTAWHYFRFAALVKRRIKRQPYRRVVFLHNMLPALMYRFLGKNFYQRFVLDIRDYFFDHFPPYHRIEKKLVESAGLRLVSSAGYSAFLPPGDYQVLHNIRWLPGEYIARARAEQAARPKDGPLRLGNVGVVREHGRNHMLLAAFGNDARFTLSFTGAGSEDLAAYIEEKSYQNVRLAPRFSLEETQDKFAQLDLVYNLFGHGVPKRDYALSNKLYYAAQLGRPILVSPHTYIAGLVEQYGLGLVVSLADEKAADKVWTYYQGIRWQAFYARCDAFLSDVRRENEATEANLAAFLGGGIAPEGAL